jgi:electron transfer flavoprotein beta subunit
VRSRGGDGGLETVALKLPGHRHRRPAPERAALRLAAEHHEGAQEADRDDQAADLGVDMAPRLTVLKVEEPPKRQAGVKVGSVAELVTSSATRRR